MYATAGTRTASSSTRRPSRSANRCRWTRSFRPRYSGGSGAGSPSALGMVALVRGGPRRIVVSVDLARTLSDDAPVPEVSPEPADVQLGDVKRGRALEDPLGHHSPDASRARDPVDRHPGRDPESRTAGHRPQRVVTVRREPVRAVDQLEDLGLLDRGKPSNGPSQKWLEHLPLGRKQLL